MDRTMIDERKGIIPMVICVIIPLSVGFVSSLITRNATLEFNLLEKPPLSPPAWLFPIAWTILYILMGIGSYFLYTSEEEGRASALVVYGMQLLMNFFWSIIFFNMGNYWLAFVWLMVMWGLIVALMMMSVKISVAALVTLVPLFVWCTFAAYLNLGIARMNPLPMNFIP